MVNDNPAKYNKDGGPHLERLTKEDAISEGLDPNEVWIMFGIKEDQDVKVAIVPGDYALKIAQGIVKLVATKLP